ncbi:MAG: DNA topoisomerase I [Nanoarchaeota archaeon]
MKKPTKTKEEKSSENYFPVDESDLKKTTEKQEKEKPQQEEILKKSKEIPVKESQPIEEVIKKSVEKIYSKPDKKQLEKIENPKRKTRNKINPQGRTPKNLSKRFLLGAKKTSKRTTIKEKKYIPPKIELKDKGYELIITEKPQAASKIAQALGKPTQKNYQKVPYYEINRNGKKIIVACAVGHLFTLKQNIPGSYIPIFDISWVPNYLARKKDFTKRYYDTLVKLAKNAGELTVATDFDIEGEVIGTNIVKYICRQKDANRMKFSTLTPNELNKAYEEKKKHIEWGQASAGEARHYIDWFYGINLSRALMNSIKTTGAFRIMSIGRVQGPALNLIVKKEKEIQEFKSVPYWQIFITVNNKKHKLELKHNRDIFNEKDLEKFKDLIGKTAEAKTKKTSNTLPPNPPFNLTTLQTEAYKFYGITPSNTLKTAQSLYLSGAISYPRTSSQKLPSSVDYKTILQKLAKKYKVEKLITKDKPIEGKKTDPAHPSIYPTGNEGIYSGYEEKIYELIVKRFLSLFCENAIIDNKTISAEVDKLIFSVRGMSIRKKAWMKIYPTKQKENEVPDMNGKVNIINQKIEKKETQPPKRYSPASIISQLEKRNLGTKATRSSIIETLYDRGYVKDKSVTATPLGISLINTLEKHSPIIIDERLTRNLEEKMQGIIKSKKDLEKKKQNVINTAKNTIIKISKDFEKYEKEIGKELLDANIKQREQQKIENKLCVCPVCKKGNLAITYSKKTRKHFIACDAYPNCKTTFSLPPGTIKKTEKLCEECGFPMLMSLRAGKRPWIFCFNKECPTNKKRIEEYRQRKELENQ